MKDQIRILESIIGKNLSAIYFQGSFQQVFPYLKNELLTYNKFCLACNGEESTIQYQYTIEPVYQEYENYHNPFKLKIRSENVLTIETPNGQFHKKEYGSAFQIGFKIGSIYVFEDDKRHTKEPNYSFLSEVEDKELLGSTIVLNDETGIRNIWINTYEEHSEQGVNETRIKFRIGNIFSEHNIVDRYRKKLVVKVGLAPRYF